jgi:AraC family transcriptional regulator
MSATLPKPKFRDGPALLLAGTLKNYVSADAPKQIPLQWGDFFALDIPGIHAAEVSYGVLVRADAESMDYMVAIELPSFDGVIAPHREIIQPAHYAVFTIDGLAHIQQMWSDIYGKWLAESGYRLAQSPAFERYDRRYDPETSSGPFEIWVPIEPAR